MAEACGSRIKVRFYKPFDSATLQPTYTVQSAQIVRRLETHSQQSDPARLLDSNLTHVIYDPLWTTKRPKFLGNRITLLHRCPNLWQAIRLRPRR